MAARTASDLAHQIEQQVATGALGPGDRLPPVREHARRLGIAPNTVAAAYRRLRERGLVVGRGRQGTVVAERPVVAPVLGQQLPPGVVDAMTGNPDTWLLPDLTAAVAAAAARAPIRYGDPLVDPGLALASEAMFTADGVDPAHLTVVSGAMDAVERLLGAHLRRGDRVGVEDPGYASVLRVVTAMGLVPVPVAVDDDGPMPDPLARAVAAGLEAFVLTPRANNPRGSALNPRRARELDRVLASDPGVFVIEDDHAGPVAGVDFVGVGRDRPRWAMVRSMAKSLGPDLRLAVVAGDRATVDRVEGRLQVGPGWVSHLLQRIVAHALTDPDTGSAVAEASRRYAARRGRLRATLAAAGIESHGRSGLSVWVPVPDEQAVVMAMLERGFAVRAGDIYRLQSPPAIRVTTAALDDATSDALAAALVDVLEPRSASTRIA